MRTKRRYRRDCENRKQAEELVYLPQVLVDYNVAAIPTRDTLPYGTQAVWNGQNLSGLGNIASGAYAFVIDSGVLNTTGDLNLNTQWSRSWILGQSPFIDGNGHGTHVAGTIGALANNRGIVGVAPGAQIVSLKVFNNTGSATLSSIIGAIDYATDVIISNGLDLAKVVINMSLGGVLDSALNAAILRAANLGIRFTIAAGNSGVDADTVSPASVGTHPNVYTVSAIDSTGTMPSWSNWDTVTPVDPLDTVDYAAPGVSIMSYYKSGLLAYLSGTSMAAPHVAGLLLMGEVTSNRMSTPFYVGTADPIAVLNNLPTVANQTLWGTAGNDTIIGGVGNDMIAGVPLVGSTSGQVDILTGGVGADIFILADSRGAFYNDGIDRTLGTNDYALIKDFQSGVDKLQLLAGNYFTTRVGSSLNIYWDRNVNGRFETSLSSSDELVAVLQNSTITSGDVIFI